MADSVPRHVPVRTVSEQVDDTQAYGYRIAFKRSQRHLGSFAIAFSQISITTGIFTTFGFLLATGGPRGIWTWVIVAVGQTLVALIYAGFAARIPLSGYGYQWGSRIANPTAGWWIGWTAFLFQVIVTPSVAYAIAQVAIQPLFGWRYTMTSTAIEAAIIVIIWGIFIAFSTKITTRVNNTAVITEIVGILGIFIALVIVGSISGHGRWANLTSTGTVPSNGYFGWLGPFMLSGLLGAFTMIGFESANAVSEETQDARRAVPRAMVRAMIVSGAVGMIFMIGLAFATKDITATTNSSAPVALIIGGVLGSVFERIFLVFVLFSMFACGMMCMVNNTRLIYAMARDRRLPGYKYLTRVPRQTGGPTGATLTSVVIGCLIILTLSHTVALPTLFTMSALLPPLMYAADVGIYIWRGRKIPLEASYFSLGKWEPITMVLAVVWLIYEFCFLYLPGAYRHDELYVLILYAIGAVVFGYLLWKRGHVIRKRDEVVVATALAVPLHDAQMETADATQKDLDV